MSLNVNELVLDKIRSLVTYGRTDGKMLFRLRSIEEPSLQCTAEGDEVTDAIGNVITTIYRAKKATLSASNSLISLDLAAAQYGTTKEVATSESKIVDLTYDILTVASGDTTVQLSKTPYNKDNILWIYSLVDGEVGTAYAADTTASATKFTVTAEGVITVPTGFTGKLYVEYEYQSENAVRVVNKANEYPTECKMVVYAYFRDKCNDNTVYSGKIICPRAKLNPEQVELALTTTGKHAFEFKIEKDYCDETDDELFTIIVAQ